MRLPGTRPLALLLLALGVGSCAETQSTTQVIVVVTTDMTPGDELNELEVRLLERDDLGNETQPHRTFSVDVAPRQGQHSMPLSFSVAPKDPGSNRDFRLIVTGLKDGDAVVEQQVIASFQPGRSLQLGIFLAGGCLGELCPDEDGERTDETCVAEADIAVCAEVEHRRMLEEWQGSGSELDVEEPVMNGDRGGGADAGEDADAGESDAGRDAGDGGASAGDAGAAEGGGGSGDGDAGAAEGGNSPPADPCDGDHGGCDPAASCDGSTGTARCTCPAGTVDLDGDGSRCDLVDCGALAAASPLHVSVDATTYGAMATYDCDAGYVLSGSLSRTCGADGSWSSSPPSCEPVDCGLPEPPARHGSVDASSGTTFGQRASYACEPNYGLAGASFVDCEADANWSAAAPECLRDCGPPPALTNGDVSEPASTLQGATASYTCDANYNLVGDDASVCGPYGGWNGTRVCDFDACSGSTVCSAEEYPCRDRPNPSASYECRGQFATWVPTDTPTSFVVNGDGTVDDTRTGLQWQRSVDPGTYDWAAAQAYCDGLGLAGGGWRLPTKIELESIVDFGASYPAINTSAFPGTPSSFAWTSSALGSTSALAWYVVFAYGGSNTGSTSNAGRVRCVR